MGNLTWLFLAFIIQSSVVRTVSIDERIYANTISFSDEVLPLIETKCSVKACHGEKQPPMLNEYKQIRRFAQRISFRINFKTAPMPPDDAKIKLTDDERKKIEAWIKQGMPNN